MAPKLPTEAEVHKAIKQLRRDSATAICNISAVLLKEGGPQVVSWLHRVICMAFIAGRAPPDWKKAVLMPLHKKVCKLMCDHYRGIALLSICGKAYTLVLLNRCRAAIERRLHEAQYGFRHGRGTGLQIFNVRKLVEMSREFSAPMHMAFIDLRKAYDSVNRDAMWRVLSLYDVDATTVNLVKDLYDDGQMCVKLGKSVSSSFSVSTGVRQGCILSPFLFNVYMDHVVRQIQAALPIHHGVEIAYRIGASLVPMSNLQRYNERNLIQFLLYADDMVLLCRNAEHMEIMLKVCDRVMEDWGLEINVGKTKVMSIDIHKVDPLPRICMRGEVVEEVDSFCYLGSIISSNASLDPEINKRICSAGAAFQKLRKRVFDDRHISLMVKMAVYKISIVPILLYGSETWALSKQQAHRLEVFQNNCLRSILGVSRADRVSVVELRQTCQQVSIANLCTKYRLRLLGHIARMEGDYRLPKQLLHAVLPDLVRPRGRPHKSWNQVVFEDLAACRLSVGWSRLCMNKGEWRRRVATAVTGVPG